jgi:class 3 adenylate cyclase
VHVFEGLSNNAEAFMAGLARTIELQRAEAAAVMSFKTRLIDYLQRFIGDLVTRSSQIAELLIDLKPLERAFLQIAAERDARNAAPGDAATDAEAVDIRLIVKTPGDDFLVEFASTVDALCCADEIQAQMAQRNLAIVPESRIDFRMGIHQGDIVVEEDGDIFGDGVNIAARLEGLAEPGGICVSARVQEDAGG